MEINPDNIQHVVPLNDLEDHDAECMHRPYGFHPLCHCKCNPRHEVVGEGMVVVHNSFDGREGVEWANEILNK